MPRVPRTGRFVPAGLERRVGRVLAALGTLGILVATLVPAPGNAAAAAATPLWCLVCGPRGEVDVVLNLLLFVPFAVGLRLAGMPFRRIVAWAAGLTLAVETLQATVIPGRDASLSDLLTNTTGAMLGAALAPLLARLGSRLS